MHVYLEYLGQGEEEGKELPSCMAIKVAKVGV